MKIVIETIAHKHQRYPTTGDWWIALAQDDRGLPLSQEELHIRVSDMGDWRYEALVGIHEAIEAVLCLDRKVDPKLVDNFDIAYEKARDDGHEFVHGSCLLTESSEPGDDIHAPYYKQHQIATGVERILAAEMGVDWNAYEKANQDLYGV